jgi:uncharacterized protein YcbK (DUF882 family)
MPAVSSPPASHLPSKKKKPSPLAVVQAVAQAAQAATAAATAVAQTSPSYVAPSSSSSSSTSSPSAPTKAPPSLAKEFIKDSKKPKTVSGKYAKATEKAKKKREKSKKAVEKKTREVSKKYETKRRKSPAPVPDPKLLTAGILENVSAYATPVNDKKVAKARKKTTAYLKKPEDDRGRYPTVKVHGTAYDAYNIAKAHDPKHVYSEDAPPISLKRYAKDRAKEIKSYSRQASTNPRKAVQRRSDRLYDLAQTVSGLPGPAPKVVLSPDTATRKTAAGKEGVAGYVTGGNDRVHVSPDIWNDLAIRGLSPETKATMFHEFAHTKQNAKTLSKSGRAEGLATRFENTVSRRTGLERERNAPTKEYHGYRKSVGKAPRKTVLRGQFKGNAYENYQIPEAGRPSGRKYTDVPEFGPGNAYKIWEGANQIAAKANELSKGKTGKAETEATRNAARAAEALSRAVSATKPEGPTPKKIKRVASNYQRAVEKATTIDAPLSADQKTFAAALARATGLSPRLAAAAVLREGGNNTDGDNNWLNIGWFDSGPDPVITTDPRWRDPATAAQLTADFLAGKEVGASEGIQNIYRVAQAGGSDEEIGRAWANSGWASSGASPLDTLDQIGTARSEPIPKNLRHKAKATLGKDVMEALRQGGKIVKDPNAGEKTKGAIPYKETKKYIIPTEARSEISAEQRAPARTMVTGMDPALQSALVQLAKNTGIPVRINEGYRTTERANDFPSGTASQHHQGNAADIDNNADYSAEDLAKVGLNNTAVGGEPWHFQLNNPDATPSTVNTNIPIKGTKLAVKVPTPASGSSTATGTASGTTFSGSAPTSTSGMTTAQIEAELKRKGVRSPSLRKRLAKIDRWMTSPLTAETPEISQELIDRILGK